MSRKLIVACTTALLAIRGVAGYSATNPENDAASIATTKVSLVDAITAAERHVHGKAIRAEYEQQEGGRWTFDVEVAAGAKIFDVKVDADRGMVITATEDKVDQDDSNDKAD